MTDPNTPSGSNPFYVSNNGTYGDPGSVSGDPNDYESWTWKQIEASVLGSSAVVPGTSGPTTNDAVANPQSLYKAGQVFYDVQDGLKMISKSILDQAMALAGPDGPWKGTSATAFLDMMTNLSNGVLAKANQINGGSANVNPVPQQLWNNGNYLLWAQNTIREIDSWYATQAIALGHQEPNGLAQISDLPNFVTAMTNDMRTVVRNLAGNYSLSISSVIVPTPIQSTPPNPNLPPPPNGGGNDSNLPPPPDTGGNDSNLPPPPDTGGNDSNLPPPPDTSGNNNTGGGGPNPDDLTAVPPPAPVSLSGPGGGGDGGLNADNLSAVPPPAPVSLSGPNGGPNTEGGLNADNLSALPPPAPLSLSGPGGGAGGLNAQDLAAVPPPLSLSGPGGAGNERGSNNLSTAPPSDPLSLSGPGGTGGDLSSQDLSGAEPPALPLPLSGPGGSGLSAGGPSGSGGGLGGQNLSAVPPSDPLSLSGPGGSGLSAGGPSGSGGGLGGQDLSTVPPSDPLSLSGPGGSLSEPGSLLSTNGGSNPSSVGGAGMPMMPGMGGGGAPNGSGGDQSDASGLLGGVTEPWMGSVLSGLGDPTGGVRPGTTGGSDLAAAPPSDPLSLSDPGAGGLDGFGTGGDTGADGLSRSDLSVPSPEGVPDEVSPGLTEPQAVGGAGMPMMPGMGGGGAPNGSGGDQSDASGLLGGVTEPWMALAPNGVGDPTGGVSPGAVPPANQEVTSGGPGPRETLGVEAALAELPLAAGLLLNGRSDDRTGRGDRRHHSPEAGTPATEPAPPTEEPAADSVALDDDVKPMAGRVAVVRPPDGTENKAAWDSSSTPFLMPFLPSGRPTVAEEETISRSAPAVPAEPEEEVLVPAEYSTFRKKSGTGAKPIVEAFVPMCGGGDAPDEEPEDEGDEQDEAEDETGPRSMSDLLSQDLNAWGSTVKASNGVLE